MNRLLAIGFMQAGSWLIKDGLLTLSITRFGEQNNVLYSFVEDGEIRYVGKSIRTLRQRMYGYWRPSTTQRTNVRINGLIKESLLAGHDVGILVLPDNGLMHYGQFHLNLAAGLEDSIIASIVPPWNGGAIKAEPEAEFEPIPIADAFQFPLQATYFERGFFNVPTSKSASLGEDGQIIDVFCGDSLVPIRALINRRSNQNGTPRILGGVELRNWFQSQTAGSLISVDVYSPVAIRLLTR